MVGSLTRPNMYFLTGLVSLQGAEYPIEMFGALHYHQGRSKPNYSSSSPHPALQSRLLANAPSSLGCEQRLWKPTWRACTKGEGADFQAGRSVAAQLHRQNPTGSQLPCPVFYSPGPDSNLNQQTPTFTSHPCSLQCHLSKTPGAQQPLLRSSSGALLPAMLSAITLSTRPAVLLHSRAALRPGAPPAHRGRSLRKQASDGLQLCDAFPSAPRAAPEKRLMTTLNLSCILCCALPRPCRSEGRAA